MDDNRMEAQERIKHECPVKIGGVYRHFKGALYTVLDLAVHSETAEILVIYKSVENGRSVWARPLDMFISPVDKEKYPDVQQVSRFERVPENVSAVRPEGNRYNRESFSNLLNQKTINDAMDEKHLYSGAYYKQHNGAIIHIKDVILNPFDKNYYIVYKVVGEREDLNLCMPLEALVGSYIYTIDENNETHKVNEFVKITGEEDEDE